MVCYEDLVDASGKAVPLLDMIHAEVLLPQGENLKGTRSEVALMMFKGDLIGSDDLVLMTLIHCLIPLFVMLSSLM